MKIFDTGMTAKGFYPTSRPGLSSFCVSESMPDFNESVAVALKTLQNSTKDDGKDGFIWLVLSLIKPAYSPSVKPIKMYIFTCFIFLEIYLFLFLI